ncbi:hypothetical protein L1887_54183 [Cichorium endivia]|nr:hypothetical protein L1887_54183 [Cichorium endivia]
MRMLVGCRWITAQPLLPTPCAAVRLFFATLLLTADFQPCLFFEEVEKHLADGVLPKSHTTAALLLKWRPPLLSSSAHVEMGQARDRQRGDFRAARPHSQPHARK